MEYNYNNFQSNNNPYIRPFLQNNTCENCTFRLNSIQADKRDKSNKTFVAAIVVVALCLFGIILYTVVRFGIFGVLTPERYEAGGYSVKSISSVMNTGSPVGREIYYYRKEYSGIQYTYDSKSVYNDLKGYIEYLEEEEGFEIYDGALKKLSDNEDDGYVYLDKITASEAEYFAVYIDYDKIGYTITAEWGMYDDYNYSKGKGV